MAKSAEFKINLQFDFLLFNKTKSFYSDLIKF